MTKGQLRLARELLPSCRDEQRHHCLILAEALETEAPMPALHAPSLR
jgi:hypothetical protein